MKTVISYRLVVESQTGMLETSVLNLLQQGYQPFGGVAVVESMNMVYKHQAMVKYEEEDDCMLCWA